MAATSPSKRPRASYGRCYWLIGSFTTGQKLSHPRNPKIHEEDSSVSAILFMCALVCCGFVVHLCRFIPSKYDRVYSLLILQVLRSVLMILCIGLMLWFFWKRRVWKEQGYIVSQLRSGQTTDGDCEKVTRPRDRPSDDHHKAELHLSTKGIVVFGAGRMVLDVVYLIRTGNCLDVTVTPEEDYVNFFYHIIYVVFLSIQVVFLVSFVHTTFKNCTYFRYAVLYLFAVDISLWFTSFIYGIRNLIRPSPGPDGNFTRLAPPIDSSPYTSHLLHCAHDTTSAHELIRDIEPYFYAFSLEYTLLAAGMLYHIWSAMEDVQLLSPALLPPRIGTSAAERERCGTLRAQLRAFWQNIRGRGSNLEERGSLIAKSDQQRPDEPREDGQRNDRNAATAHLSEDKITIEGDDQSQQNTPVTDCNSAQNIFNAQHVQVDQSSPRDMDEITELPSAEQRNDVRPKERLTESKHIVLETGKPAERQTNLVQSIKQHASLGGLFFMVGSVFSITVIVFAYLLFHPHPEERDKSLYQFYCIRTLFYASLSVCCWSGFHLLKRHDCEKLPFREDATLLIISVNGSFLYAFFGITAAIGAVNVGDYSHYPRPVPYIVILECSFNLVEYWLQVIFLVSSLRYFPARGQSIIGLVRVYSYLFVCNFGMWVLDSFFETMAVDLSPVQRYYYGDEIWHIITDLAYPFAIFFRFHSFVVAYSLFARFMEQPPDTNKPVNESIVV
ncbi:uncharacterized protein [Ptychodera flava]|uniref:uncharacterized protein n=1 Tax=Ptychodera flava TaxID=63121 RepID=UPI00396A8A0C